MRPRRRAQTVAVLLASVVAWMPTSAAFVERWYSRGWYPSVQRIVTPVSNLVPFAILDLLILSAAFWVVYRLRGSAALARRTRRWTPLLGFGLDVAAAAAGVYLVFLALWGLNYRRLPVEERLVLASEAPRHEAVVALGLESARRANELHPQAHASEWRREEWRDGALEMALRDTQRSLGDVTTARAGRLKWTILGPYFRWAGVDGMVDPFALEALGNPDLLPWERPFVAAHEWAHLAGYAHESEASFVGWLVCQRAGAQAQYSGWLYLYWELAGNMSPRDRSRLREALEPGPQHDLDAIAERLRRGHVPVLQQASWRVYDRYLRANRVEEGIRDYGEVVTLLLRTQFDEGWVPVRRKGN